MFNFSLFQRKCDENVNVILDFKHVLTEFPLLKGISSSTKRKCEGRLPGTVGTMPVGVKRYSKEIWFSRMQLPMPLYTNY